MDKHQKMNGSVFWLTGGIVVLILVFKVLFGAMYPEDSARSYANEEITRLAPADIFQPEALNGIQEIIEGKGKRKVYLQEITEIRTDSGGTPVSVRLRLLTLGKGETKKYISYILSLQEGEKGSLMREEGYRELGFPAEDLIPYSFLSRMGKGPLQELANLYPIDHDSGYLLTMRPDQGDCVSIREKGGELPSDGTPYFIRLDNGYFQVTGIDQVSQRYLQVTAANIDGGNPTYQLLYEME